jgi:hypothetical protein
VKTAELAKMTSALLYVCVLQDIEVILVRSTLMNANLIRAKIMLRVLRALPAILAIVNQVLPDMTAKLTSMNVRTHHVKTMENVMMESPLSLVIVMTLVLKGLLAKSISKDATVVLVKMVPVVLMESMITFAIAMEVMRGRIAR